MNVTGAFTMSDNDTKEFPALAAEPTNVENCSDGNQLLEVGFSIDKGQVRQNNEDSLAALTINQANEADCQSVGVYAVADGMGGHQAGEVASKLAVRTAIQDLVSNVTDGSDDMPENYREWLKSATTVANQMVHRKASEDNKNMGTTLVMAVVAGHDVHIANVGDSRAYVISPRDIRQVTRDHSFVQMLVDSGSITPEQAAVHPRRNILTQSIGTEENVHIDVFSETLDADESLLLCSDGLWETLNNEQIQQIVLSADTPSAACQALIDAANAAGARDNIAAVLVRLGAPPVSATQDAITEITKVDQAASV